ncbi:hypothetical protein [Exiguobacterium sp. s133]|uniref:hypothetical protein n=1 Tax=Exiguobacterium sp. s133 TaxID=2751213 RepID=UPI001BEA6D64|nr:hypothetical protein [Exiguobacterium sp. s133]
MIIQTITKPDDTAVTLEVNGKGLLYYSQITPNVYECMVYPDYSFDDYIHQEAHTLKNVLFDPDEEENEDLDKIIFSKDYYEKSFVIKSNNIEESLKELIQEVFQNIQGSAGDPSIKLINSDVVIDGYDVGHVGMNGFEPYTDMAYGSVIDYYLSNTKQLKRGLDGFEIAGDPLELVRAALKYEGLLN